MNHDTIMVVEESHAKDEAYRQGFEHFQNIDPEDVPEGEEPFTTRYFKEGDRWANHVAPRLRAMAGLTDAGHGTYQLDGPIALVEQGDEDDQPKEATIISARQFYHELVDEFDRGANMAADHATNQGDAGP